MSMPTSFRVCANCGCFSITLTFVAAGPNGPDPEKLRIKVGSSITLIERLGQWQRQCRSVLQVLRGHWPARLDDEYYPSAVMKLVDPGPKGPFCRRVERLVHLELMDLVVNGQYLHPDFTVTETDSCGDLVSSKEWRTTTGKGVLRGQECLDCTFWPYYFCVGLLTSISRRSQGAQGNIHVE
jgi:hypothetical protein